ncbi:uncharacterized protein LOC111400500 [Olea europaea var. sylvestris]|uniref:uncharacterized protein LOC111400500 n=1 Tax=Olea europaea var. sylvestris TaxID=158386 RepID=UPI000C1D0875|nr:uncharacterized protein LOC111400500 [Olea europaea var. sylvestris]
MGSALSNTANGVGTLVGNALAAPFKSLFGSSCEGVCSGTWDVECFIEHLCFSNLFQLLMVSRTNEVGICQCIGRSLIKICWGSCQAYWFALEDMTCFLWYKLKNVERVNRRRRRRFQGVEVGYTISSCDEEEEEKKPNMLYSDIEMSHSRMSKKRKFVRMHRQQGHGHHRHHHGMRRSKKKQQQTYRSRHAEPAASSKKRRIT